METCQRCLAVGEDRRTIRMNCFYNMNELGLPFEQQVFFQTDHEKLVKKEDPVGLTINGTVLNLKAGTVTTEEPLTPQSFFALRVCKKCRGDWLEAMKAWFWDDKARLQARINELEAEIRSIKGEDSDVV
jgi:hypothetical protein